MADQPKLRIKLNPSFWRHPNGVPFSEDVIPSSLFLKNRHYVVVDIETQQLAEEIGGWENMHLFKVSVACAYDSKTDTFLTFRENELSKLFALCEDRLVVGYNIRGFDLPVLGLAYGLNYRELDVFDIMYDVEAITRQRFLKLETIAQGTLGAGKSADGKLAVTWWKEGKIDQIIEYCLQDVKVTRDIFQFGRQNSYIKMQMADGSTKQIPVQWN